MDGGGLAPHPRHRVRVCLFSDRANPTSNRLYETLGYRPVVDMADLRVEAPGE